MSAARARFARYASLAVAILTASIAARSQAADDNFNDNNNSPQWVVIQDNAAALAIDEVNGQVEIEADGSSIATDDAIFLSDASAGFALSTAADFEIQIQFTLHAFNATGGFGDAFAFVFGVGEDLDGQNSAAVGWGLGNLGINTQSIIVTDYRVNDISPGVNIVGAGPNPGSLPQTVTFVAAYTALTDRLTFSVPELALSEDLDGLVQGQWGASALRYSFGARGEGYSVAGDEAYFDNFQVTSGVFVPEPAVGWLCGLAVLGAAAVRRASPAL